MKHKTTFFIAILIFFILSGCKKNQKDNWFYIEIKSSVNRDCGVPEIIFLDRQQEAYEIIGYNWGIYVASGLPKVLYAVSTRMYVSIKRPVNNEIIACTALGPGFPQVHITSVKQ